MWEKRAQRLYIYVWDVGRIDMRLFRRGKLKEKYNRFMF